MNGVGAAAGIGLEKGPMNEAQFLSKEFSLHLDAN